MHHVSRPIGGFHNVTSFIKYRLIGNKSGIELTGNLSGCFLIIPETGKPLLFTDGGPGQNYERLSDYQGKLRELFPGSGEQVSEILLISLNRAVIITQRMPKIIDTYQNTQQVWL